MEGAVGAICANATHKVGKHNRKEVYTPRLHASFPPKRQIGHGALNGLISRKKDAEK